MGVENIQNTQESAGEGERKMELVEQAVEEYATKIKGLIEKVNQIAISVRVPEIEELALPEVQKEEGYQYGDYVASYYIEPIVEKVFTKEELMEIDIQKVNEAARAMEYIPNLSGELEEARGITLSDPRNDPSDVIAVGQEIALRKAALEAVFDCARMAQRENTES